MNSDAQTETVSIYHGAVTEPQTVVTEGMKRTAFSWEMKSGNGRIPNETTHDFLKSDQFTSHMYCTEHVIVI